MENTASWVDEKYGRLLAKQHIGVFTGNTPGVNYNDASIQEARKDSGYLFEEKALSTGFGVKKPVTRMYVLQVIPEDGLVIGFSEFNSKGKVVLHKKNHAKIGRDGHICVAAKLHVVMTLTYHAHSRLFERLRTNSGEEVVEVIKTLVKCVKSLNKDPRIIGGGEVTLTIPGLGRFEIEAVVTETAGKGSLRLVLKTFIAEKRS